MRQNQIKIIALKQETILDKFAELMSENTSYRRAIAIDFMEKRISEIKGDYKKLMVLGITLVLDGWKEEGLEYLEAAANCNLKSKNEVELESEICVRLIQKEHEAAKKLYQEGKAQGYRLELIANYEQDVALQSQGYQLTKSGYLVRGLLGGTGSKKGTAKISKEEIDKYIDEADQLFGLRLFGRAIEKYTKALRGIDKDKNEEKTRYAQLCNKLGKAYFENHAYESARKFFIEAYDLSKDVLDYCLDLARFHILRWDLKEAKTIYEKAAELIQDDLDKYDLSDNSIPVYPDKASLLEKKAECLFRLGEIQKEDKKQKAADENFKTAINTYKDSLDIYNNRSTQLTNCLNKDKKDFETEIQNLPEYATEGAELKKKETIFNKWSSNTLKLIEIVFQIESLYFITDKKAESKAARDLATRTYTDLVENTEKLKAKSKFKSVLTEKRIKDIEREYNELRKENEAPLGSESVETEKKTLFKLLGFSAAQADAVAWIGQLKDCVEKNKGDGILEAIQQLQTIPIDEMKDPQNVVSLVTIACNGDENWLDAVVREEILRTVIPYICTACAGNKTMTKDAIKGFQKVLEAEKERFPKLEAQLDRSFTSYMFTIELLSVLLNFLDPKLLTDDIKASFKDMTKHGAFAVGQSLSFGARVTKDTVETSNDMINKFVDTELAVYSNGVIGVIKGLSVLGPILGGPKKQVKNLAHLKASIEHIHQEIQSAKEFVLNCATYAEQGWYMTIIYLNSLEVALEMEADYDKSIKILEDINTIISKSKKLKWHIPYYGVEVLSRIAGEHKQPKIRELAFFGDASSGKNSNDTQIKGVLDYKDVKKGDTCWTIRQKVLESCILHSYPKVSYEEFKDALDKLENEIGEEKKAELDVIKQPLVDFQKHGQNQSNIVTLLAITEKIEEQLKTFFKDNSIKEKLKDDIDHKLENIHVSLKIKEAAQDHISDKKLNKNDKHCSAVLNYPENVYPMIEALKYSWERKKTRAEQSIEKTNATPRRGEEFTREELEHLVKSFKEFLEFHTLLSEIDVQDGICEGFQELFKSQLEQMMNSKLEPIDEKLGQISGIVANIEDSIPTLATQANQDEIENKIEGIGKKLEIIDKTVSDFTINTSEKRQIISKEAFIQTLKNSYLNDSHITRLNDDPLRIEECDVNVAIVKESTQKEKDKTLASDKNKKALEQEDRQGILGYWEDIHAAKEDIELEDIFNPIKVERSYKEGKTVKEDGAIHRKILVLGRAGIGKTTLCQKITHAWANGALWSDKYDLIIRLNLRDINPDDFPKKEQGNYSRSEIITRLCIEGEEVLTEELLKEINDGDKVLYILDGYDETAQLEEKGNKYLRDIRDQLIQNAPNMILTSRPCQITNIVKDLTLETVGFKDEQIKTYIKNTPHQRPEGMGEADYQKMIEDLEGYITTNANIHALCHIPILLDLVCSVCVGSQGEGIGGTELITMTGLYKKLEDHLIRRYYRRIKKIDPKKASRLEKKKTNKVMQVLGKVAYENMESGKIYIEAKALERIHDGIEAADSDSRSEITLQDVEDMGIIKPIGKGDITMEKSYFLHLSLQEYFAAEYLSNQPIEIIRAFIKKHKYKPQYQMMLSFLAGIIYENDESEYKEKIVEFFELIEKDDPKDLTGLHHAHLLIELMNECPDIDNLYQRINGKFSIFDSLILRICELQKLKNSTHESIENLVKRCEVFFDSNEVMGKCVDAFNNKTNNQGIKLVVMEILQVRGRVDREGRLIGALIEFIKDNNIEGKFRKTALYTLEAIAKNERAEEIIKALLSIEDNGLSDEIGKSLDELLFRLENPQREDSCPEGFIRMKDVPSDISSTESDGSSIDFLQELKESYIQTLKDENATNKEKVEAAKSICDPPGSFGIGNSLELVLSVIRNEEISSKDRAEVIKSFSRKKHFDREGEIAQTFISFFKEGNDLEDRVIALEGLGNIIGVKHEEKTIPILLEFLNNREIAPKYRISSVKALGEIGKIGSDGQVFKSLSQFFESATEFEHKTTTLEALRKIGKSCPEALKTLVALLNTKKNGEILRSHAAKAIGEVGESKISEEAINALISFLNEIEIKSEYRVPAAEALEKVSNLKGGVIQSLINFLKDSRAAISHRASVAKILNNMDKDFQNIDVTKALIQFISIDEDHSTLLRPVRRKLADELAFKEYRNKLDDIENNALERILRYSSIRNILNWWFETFNTKKLSLAYALVFKAKIIYSFLILDSKERCLSFQEDNAICEVKIPKEINLDALRVEIITSSQQVACYNSQAYGNHDGCTIL